MASATNAPGFSTENGWEFNGTNKRVDIGITVTDDYTILFSMRVLGAGGSSYGRLMELSSSDLTLIIPYDGGARLEFRWGNVSKLISDMTSPYSAVLGINNDYGYIDGSSAIAINGILDPSGTLFIGNNGAANRGFNGYVYATSVYDTVLTPYQVAAISAAMAALDGGAKSQSLEGMLSFEAEEEKLWWQGADVDVLAQAQPQVELTWWDKANRVVNAALAKAKKFIDDKLYQLWQAIEDYFTYDEEE